MRTLSRFIPGEEIEAVSQWSFGSVDTDSLRLAAKARDEQEALSRIRDEAVRKDAYAKGFEQGRAHAIVEAEKKVRDYAKG
ncbi:MAG: flagellar assembly protein FliH, partial [Rhodoferax sp.]|nr:flagellar assembly protein FliH [Rhodoferax sp.]